MNRRKRGKEAEDMAAAEMKKRGCHILQRNYRCPLGEIDLIYQDGKTLVFAEVKYRRSPKNGWPQEAVDAGKQSRIRSAASWYLMEHGISENLSCRFDVISILGQTIVVYKNAFE